MEESLHVSLDLETLDTEQSSVVVAVGAVFFTPTKIYDKYPFYRQLQLEPQFRLGRTISEATLRWWMVQSEEARKSTFSGKDFIHPKAMFTSLKDWADRQGVGLYGEEHFPTNPYHFSTPGVGPTQIQGWWFNGPSFDGAIMENLARQLGVALPWRYNDPRDFRVMRDLLPRDLHPTREGTFHNGFDDAVFQAKLIQRAWQYLDQHKEDAAKWREHITPAPRVSGENEEAGA